MNTLLKQSTVGLLRPLTKGQDESYHRDGGHSQVLNEGRKHDIETMYLYGKKLLLEPYRVDKIHGQPSFISLQQCDSISRM
mmetsp:Transcript_3499/g.4954  ORF Transcript_3499/g.4954 Transcript_3499/m.4954 type:complete len:81 (+) Transcript_3499:330-572(+)